MGLISLENRQPALTIIRLDKIEIPNFSQKSMYIIFLR